MSKQNMPPDEMHPLYPEHPLDPNAKGSGASACSVPRELLEALLDNTYELRGDRDWWKDEPRLNYQRDYQRYCDEIKQAEQILERSQGEIICAKCGLREEQGSQTEADF